jgi:hypothetical protein
LDDPVLFKTLDPDLVIVGFLGWLNLIFRSLTEFRNYEISVKGMEAISRFTETIGSQLSGDLSSLFDSGRWQTTDPRDRVYAMMGSMPGFMQLGMKVNYRISPEELFIRTTVEILRAVQKWSDPQFVYPSASPFLPSWTIDFTLPTTDTEQWLRRTCDKFNTAPGAKFNVTELCPGVIISAGFVYDEIVAVSPVHSLIDPRKPINSPGIELLFWKWWNFLMNSDNQRLLSRRENDRWASYCRTLCLDSKEFSQKGAASFRQWKLDSDPVKRNIPWKLEWMLKSSISSSARLVITRTGRIGLVPLAIEPGDYIAILAGGDVPFALRKVRKEGVYRDAYRLLGGCYVDGQLSNSMSSYIIANMRRNHVRQRSQPQGHQ